MKKKDIIDYVKSNNIKTFDEFKSKNLELFIFAHNNRLLSGLGIKDKYPKTYFNGFKLEKEVSPAPSNESAASKEKVIKKKTTKKTEKRGRPKKNSKQCQQFNRLDDDVDKNRINHYKYLYSFKIDYPHMIHKNAELSECLDDTIKDKRSLLFFLNKNGIKKYIDILGMLNDEELFFLALKINVFGSSRKHNIKTTYYEVKTGHVPCSVETFLKNSNMNKVDMDICKYIYKTKITFRKLKKDLLYKKIINIYDIRLFYSFLEHKSKFFKFKNHRTSKTTYFQDHLISTYFKGKRNTDIYSYFIYKRNSIPKSMRLQPKYFREKYGIIGVRKHMYGKGKYKEKSREELKELISSFDGYRSEFIKKYKTDWSRIRKDQELLLFYQSEIKKKKNQERAEESYHQEIITKIKDRLNVKIINEYSIPNRRRVDLLIYIEGKKIPVEIKMDNRYWSKNEINHQLKNYNNYFEEKKCFTKTYLVSPLGKYGYSEDEFLNILEKFINGNNLKDPKYPQGYNKLEKKKEDNISKDSLDYFSVLATVLTLENPKKLCMYPREYSWARKNGLLDHFYNDFKD